MASIGDLDPFEIGLFACAMRSTVAALRMSDCAPRITRTGFAASAVHTGQRSDAVPWAARSASPIFGS